MGACKFMTDCRTAASYALLQKAPFLGRNSGDPVTVNENRMWSHRILLFVLIPYSRPIRYSTGGVTRGCITQ